jgi:hypothetical protein
MSFKYKNSFSFWHCVKRVFTLKVMNDYADRTLLVLLIIFEFILIFVCIVNAGFFNMITGTSPNTTYTQSTYSLTIANAFFVIALLIVTAFTIYILVLEIRRDKEIGELETQNAKMRASIDTSVHSHVEVLAKSLKKTKTELDSVISKIEIPQGDPTAPAFPDDPKTYDGRASDYVPLPGRGRTENPFANRGFREFVIPPDADDES